MFAYIKKFNFLNGIENWENGVKCKQRGEKSHENRNQRLSKFLFEIFYTKYLSTCVSISILRITLNSNSLAKRGSFAVDPYQLAELRISV